MAALALAVNTIAGPQPALARAPAATQITLDGLRGTRWCEVLVVHEASGNATATIYSTLGLDRCLPVNWQALRPADVAAALKARTVLEHGPLFGTADRVAFSPQGPTTQISGMTMQPVARLDVPLGSLRPTTFTQPYTEATLKRSVRWTWNAGRPVYELVSSNGRRYAMESLSRNVDAHESAQSLATLGKRLKLPYKWTYRVVTPKAPLVVDSVDGTEHVLQDDLHNVYAREN